MKTLPPLKTRDSDWDAQDEDTQELPGRPRRRILTWWTALLMALILGGIGFYVGIRVEKGQTGRSASGFSLPSTGTGGFRGGAAVGVAGFGGAAAPGGAGGAAPGGAGASFGTVSSISGDTLYVTDASGNTVKVQLSSATQISKSVNVSKKSLRPGDTVVIGGLTNKKGTVVATSVRDSGASGGTGTATGSSSDSGGGSATSGKAAVSSLFGSGG